MTTGVEQVPLEQVFPLAQAAHVAPPVPHRLFCSIASGTQMLRMQQPLQLPGPQLDVPVTHAPAVHICPVEHALQLPPSEPQKNAPPLVTHVPRIPSMQPPTQPASTGVVQAPAVHVCVTSQPVHANPKLPHANLD